MIQFSQLLGVEVIFAVLLAHCLPTGVAMNVYNQDVEDLTWRAHIAIIQADKRTDYILLLLAL